MKFLLWNFYVNFKKFLKIPWKYAKNASKKKVFVKNGHKKKILRNIVLKKLWKKYEKLQTEYVIKLHFLCYSHFKN